MNRRIVVGAVVAADIAALVLLRPSVLTLLDHLHAPGRWLASDGVDRALAVVASAGIWCAAAVLGAGLLAAAAAGVPGVCGRTAAHFAQALLPRVVQRLVAGSAGLGVLLAPIAAGAATDHHLSARPAASASTQASASASATDPLPAPTWPMTGSTASAPLPAPTWPATDTWAEHVTVRPGDSLWLIAGRGLGRHASGADIGRSWPRWYAANRDVIGDDPALIHPGEVLRAPGTRREDPA